MHVVHSNCTPDQFDSVQVVHGQNGRPLVLVAQEPEALGLARTMVSHQINMDNLSTQKRNKVITVNKIEFKYLSILAEYSNHVTLSEVVGQATHEDPGRVPIIL